MKKKKSKSIFCPCCKMHLHRTEFKQVGKNISSGTENEYFDYWLTTSRGIACDSCLQKKKAILANPKLQYASDTFHLAYFDENRTCKTCGDDYIFSKEEKKHWYEKLQLWVYAQSVNCKKCSKEIRVERNLNTRLSNLLKNGEDALSIEQKTEIISIYQSMEKPEKAKMFLKKWKLDSLPGDESTN